MGLKFRAKPVQLVRHMHEVHPQYKNAVAAGKKYMVQVKEDGVFAFAIYGDDGWMLISRTGRLFTNLSTLLASVDNKCLRSYVYIMEVVDATRSLEELSGLVNPYRKEPVPEDFNPVGRVHDLVPLDDFIAGYSAWEAVVRYDLLKAQWYDTAPVPNMSLVSTVFDRDEVQIRLIAEAVIAVGKEGIVVKQQDADWKAGRKTAVSMKIVRGCSYDLRCIRVEQGEGKRRGMVANAICEWRLYGDPKGDLVEIPVDMGKGFTDDLRRKLWLDQSRIVGKVVEVNALQVGSKGSLRLPKVNSIRIDKEASDVE